MAWAADIFSIGCFGAVLRASPPPAARIRARQLIEQGVLATGEGIEAGVAQRAGALLVLPAMQRRR